MHYGSQITPDIIDTDALSLAERAQRRLFVATFFGIVTIFVIHVGNERGWRGCREFPAHDH